MCARDRLLESQRDTEEALGRVVRRFRRRTHHLCAERTQHVDLRHRAQHSTWHVESRRRKSQTRGRGRSAQQNVNVQYSRLNAVYGLNQGDFASPEISLIA